MFEVHGVYANRKGKYTVLAINPPKMSVRYEDGSQAKLNMRMQARIWENIVVEQEAQEAKAASRAARKGTSQTRFFIKAISIPDAAELMFPGWQENVIMASDNLAQIKIGTRIIYYAIEAQIFFAVATIIGEAFAADPKKYFFTSDLQTANFFSVDMDAFAHVLEHGVRADSIELESCPQLKTKALTSEAFLEINEDDFEMLSEMLTEVSEEEAEVIDDEDEYEEEEDE
ncbi:MAG: hypothetical protein GY803_14595 [Chloroflexi bacterium]|nr:hypothetical protein [Chloroflexota bacterium]